MWTINIKNKAIGEWTELSSKTITKVIRKTIECIESKTIALTGKIGGPGVIVEIDESKFGKVKYHRGHRVEGVWVFGMVERTPHKKIIMIVIENRKRPTLEEILKQYVHPESTICSDCFKS